MECQCDELRDKIRNMVITCRNDSNDAIAEIDHLTTQLLKTEQTLEDTKRSLAEANAKVIGWPNLFDENMRLAGANDALRQQLAEWDAEIALLRQQSVGWVQVFDENAALREEVERLNELVSRYDGIKDELQMDKAELQIEVERLRKSVGEWCKTSEMYRKFEAEARKQAAQEIVDMLRADRWAESELKDIIEKFGLEGGLKCL